MKTRILLLATFVLGACSPTSPKREPPPIVHNGIEVNAASKTQVVNSKVDILFVVDNSGSMTDDQQNIARNIDGFVKAFSEQTLIDFHVGVTTVYDTAHQAPRGMPNGILRPVKNKSGQVTDGPRFITRNTPDYLISLKQTLTVGVMQPSDGGPENEESFSPVAAALSEPALSSENSGFYRSDAYLMVIFLTDANDESPTTSAEELYAFLLKLKGNDPSKIMTIGALFPNFAKGEYDQPDVRGALYADTIKVCPNGNQRDPGGPPYRIVEFLSKSEGTRLSLCDQNFGPELADIGINLSAKIANQVIRLNDVPDKTRDPKTGLINLKVFYGDKPLCGNDPVADKLSKDCDYGKLTWEFDDPNNTIIIPGNLKIQAKEGAVFTVRYIPMDINSKYTKVE